MFGKEREFSKLSDFLPGWLFLLLPHYISSCRRLQDKPFFPCLLRGQGSGRGCFIASLSEASLLIYTVEVERVNMCTCIRCEELRLPRPRCEAQAGLELACLSMAGITCVSQHVQL